MSIYLAINKINYVVGDFDSIEEESIKTLESFNKTKDNNTNISNESPNKEKKNKIIFEKINCQDTTDLQKCYKILKREFIDNEHVKKKTLLINNTKINNLNNINNINIETEEYFNDNTTTVDLNKSYQDTIIKNNRNSITKTSEKEDINIQNNIKHNSNSSFYDYENKLRKINNKNSDKEITVNLNFFKNNHDNSKDNKSDNKIDNEIKRNKSEKAKSNNSSNDKKSSNSS